MDQGKRLTRYFVTRHPGAIVWASRRGIEVDEFITHLDPAIVHPGDTVIGILPVNLAAQVCERGARYYNLSLSIPPDARGMELNAEELERYDARIEEFMVQHLSPR